MNGFVRRGDHAEIRPDRPVENMGTDDFQRRLGGMNSQRTIAHVADRIDHERHAGQMIKVGMGDENMIDLRQFGDRQIARRRCPASIRMSLSTSSEVVRRWRPPIPPLQPSMRTFMFPISSRMW
jgi:hypothetical protein